MEISSKIKSLFFSLKKRTKNQGCGIVVKAQLSIFIEDFEMNIFPNPASDLINVSFIASNFSPFELLIINQEGVVVSRQKGSTQEGKNSIEVLLQDLPAGAYHSLLQIGNLRSNKEFIKVN